MVALGEGFEQAAIAFNIIPLQGVDEGEKAARLQHPCDFGGDPAANLIGQFVIEVTMSKLALSKVSASAFACSKVTLRRP